MKKTPMKETLDFLSKQLKLVEARWIAERDDHKADIIRQEHWHLVELWEATMSKEFELEKLRKREC